MNNVLKRFRLCQMLRTVWDEGTTHCNNEKDLKVAASVNSHRPRQCWVLNEIHKQQDGRTEDTKTLV